VHCNDWQAALLPLYISAMQPGEPLAGTKTVLTIHNLGYQGTFPAEQIYATGLPWDRFNIDELEFFGNLNLLKGGISAADLVTTVSPTYAKEIQTPEHGFGLDGFLKHFNSKLRGILNGIDTEIWNPATDPLIWPTQPGIFAGKSRCNVPATTSGPGHFPVGAVSRSTAKRAPPSQSSSRNWLPATQLVIGPGSGRSPRCFAVGRPVPDQVVFHNSDEAGTPNRSRFRRVSMPSAYEPRTKSDTASAWQRADRP
jgi:hypothetical protein